MTPSTATAVEHDPVPAPRTVITLLDLVRELGEAGATDREIVAAVTDLLETGRVRLIGQICDEHLLAHGPAETPTMSLEIRESIPPGSEDAFAVGRRSRTDPLPAAS